MREPRKHGTRAMYQRGECRCPECSTANTEYQERYRTQYEHARKNDRENRQRQLARVRRLAAKEAGQ